MKTFICNNEAETEAVGKKISSILHGGDLVGLNGDLGAGKTFLCKRMIGNLGVSEEVTSPSYTILNEYGNIYHFDVYRLNDIEEMYDIGYEEYFFSDGICFVEWSDEVASLLPEAYFKITMTLGQNLGQRIIEIQGTSPDYDARLEALI